MRFFVFTMQTFNQIILVQTKISKISRSNAYICTRIRFNMPLFCSFLSVVVNNCHDNSDYCKLLQKFSYMLRCSLSVLTKIDYFSHMHTNAHTNAHKKTRTTQTIRQHSSHDNWRGPISDKQSYRKKTDIIIWI